MGWKTDQILPKPEVESVVVERGIKPALNALCERFQLGKVVAAVGIWLYDNPVREIGAVVCGDREDGTKSIAQIRLYFRRTINPHRFLFFAQMRMDDPNLAHSIAGVILRGEALITDGGKTQVETTSCTTVFNGSPWLNPS